MFNFASPWIFLLLPLPFILRWLWPHGYAVTNSALKIPFFQRIKSLQQQQQTHNISFNKSYLLALIIWMLCVVAAAGPQWVSAPIPLPREGRNIFMAIDISGSMETPDMTLGNQPLTRLQLVKQVASDFINKRKSDRIGLILFGTRAYVYPPLTFDTDSVISMLQDSTVGLAGQQTAMGDAIGLAIKRLQQQPANSRVLILLTDGANNAGKVMPIDAAELAAKLGIKIYTIGLGAKQVRVNTFFGEQLVNPSADLDEKTLQKIANTTGGKYFRATNSQSLQNIYQDIDKLEPITEHQAFYRPVKNFYYWPLVIALLLSMLIAFSKIVRRYYLSRQESAS